MSEKLSVLSIDVEDGLSLAMRDIFSKSIPQTDRVYRNTMEFLELVSKKNVKATFFTLGIVARKFPNLIHSILNEGHELAVHGHNHKLFHRMTPVEALNELIEAKESLEQVSGVRIKGHRAPAFSISPNTPWAFEVLIEAGFEYDSSIMPVNSRFHGWNNFPKDITNIETQSGSITEFPISVLSVMNKSIPFSGGTYLRLAPSFITQYSFIKVLERRPVVVYFHPYEFDTVKYPEFYFKEMKKLPLTTQVKLRSNFINRSQSQSKLEDLIERFKFSTMEVVIEQNIKSAGIFKI
jgi:polysaccharide deacetylase family protein (PEP-CTERM system associated)